MTDIVERLRADGGELAAEAAAEIERLHAHIIVLETEIIRSAGTVRKLHEERIREEPFRVDYDQPPNTPR